MSHYESPFLGFVKGTGAGGAGYRGAAWRGATISHATGMHSSAFFLPAIASAGMPATADPPCVLEIRRRLPAYAGGEPMEILRRTPFAGYLEEIRPRLEALEAGESEPRGIPWIFESWEKTELSHRQSVPPGESV